VLRYQWTTALTLAVGLLAATAPGAQAAAVRATNPAAGTGDQNPVAMRQLEAARLTLVRLDEHSMSQDDRAALTTLTDEFHALYRSYTGLDMDRLVKGREAAAYDDSMVRPRNVWKNYYFEADRTLNRILGTSPASTSAGSEGAAASVVAPAPDLRAGLPQPARRDFNTMRTQLEAFYKAADRPNVASAH
jgi:hypothetical protein